MLRVIKEDLKDYYYDPNYHGIDLDEHFRAAEQRIKQAKSTAQIFGILGQVLIDLDDSHTSFIPPAQTRIVDYGWRMQMFGNKAYIVAVKPDSDAAMKGLKVGEEVYSVDGFQPTRENLWEFEYSYYVLMPALRMTVVTREQDGTLRDTELASGIIDVNKIRGGTPDQLQYFEANKETIISKLLAFRLSDKEVDEMMKKCGQYQTLILDLRGNSGGSETMLQRLVGYFFDHDVKIADAKGRKESRAVIAKSRGVRAFKGRLVVLVDSKSASAAEVFARVVQLEKRGVVIGDRTAGKVMAAITIGHPFGYVREFWDGPLPPQYFGIHITVDDVIMPDGKSLEMVGITPDELLLPTASDLANHQDPVLSRAAKLVGLELDSQKAGTLFPSNNETGTGKGKGNKN